jgi:hypothetical protein
MPVLQQLTDQRATLAANAANAVREMYLAHEIDATEYASLMEDVALVARRTR